MKYDIHKLGSSNFESLTQALARKILGNGTIAFGDGPDGGREATFEGSAPFPSDLHQWKGYWVIQAKFKTVATIQDANDPAWLKTQIQDELIKYASRKVKVRKPDNLLFFTNITLTPTAGTGGRDKINLLVETLKNKYQIGRIAVIANDDITGILDANRDIAIAYGGFIVPGDILFRLYQLLGKSEFEARRLKNYLSLYLESEFKSNVESKLEQAGKNTADRINLEKVFVDLSVNEKIWDDSKKFIKNIVKTGDSILKGTLEKRSKFVLIAGPGYGKSTLTQYLSQIYRANYLLQSDSAPPQEVVNFEEDIKETLDFLPVCRRIPFRIILKEYASWIRDRTSNSLPGGVILYISETINKRIGHNLYNVEDVEELIENFPTLFVFDGLDEVPASSNREDVLHELRTFTILLRRGDSDTLLIGTSRPQGYSNDFDSYLHLNIADLSKDEAYTYVEKLLKSIESDLEARSHYLHLLRQALEEPVIGRLMRSPLQASIMTILVKSGGEPPTNKYELFREYYETIFKRERQKGVAKIINQKPSYIHGIHNRLGFHLQVISESSSSPAAVISIEDFKTFIRSYLLVQGVEDNEEVSGLQAEIVDAAMHRLIFIEEIIEGKIGFNIRSIQEYFAANYYVKCPDNEIENRLRSIAVASYWNNAYLFCVANILQNKDYAVQQIFAVNEELNGLQHSYGQKSLNSIIKQGSWNALDILIEGTFRDLRNYENLLAREIITLLSLPRLTKHNELRKLPDNVRKDWLFPILKDEISKSGLNNFTAWGIIFELAHDRYFDEPFFISHLEGGIYSDEFFQFVNAGGLLNSSFGAIYLEKYVLKQASLNKVNFILDISSDILLNLARSSENYELHSILFKVLSLNEFSWHNSDHDTSKCLNYLYSKAGVSYSNVNILRQISSRQKGRIEFAILTGMLHGTIRSVTLVDASQSQEIFAAAEYYRFPLLISIVKFLISPSYSSLNDVVIQVDETSNKWRNIRGTVADINWVFKIQLSEDPSLEELKTRYIDLNSNFETWSLHEKSWKDAATGGTNLKNLMAFTSSRTAYNSIANVLKHFLEKFSEDIDSIWNKDIANLISWCAHSNAESNPISFTKREEDLLLTTLEKWLLRDNSSRFQDPLSIAAGIVSLFSKEFFFDNVKRLEPICSRLSEMIEGRTYSYRYMSVDTSIRKLHQVLPVIHFVAKGHSLFAIYACLLGNSKNLTAEVSSAKLLTFELLEFENVRTRLGYLALMINSEDRAWLKDFDVNRLDLFPFVQIKLLVEILSCIQLNEAHDKMLIYCFEKIKGDEMAESSIVGAIRDYVQSRHSGLELTP